MQSHERGRLIDALAVALAVLLAGAALQAGLREGFSSGDVDEVVYLRTLWGMQDGQSYYDATREALTQKEGAPPSQLRSVRPPTLYLALEPFPQDAWRWLAGGLFLAILLLAWRLARATSAVAGVVGVVMVGIWMWTASPWLFLHAELWGLPFVLGGLLALRNRRWWLAALLLVMAVGVRELYLVYFLAALVFVPRRRWFVVGGGVLAVAGTVHVALASRILDPDGREADFGKDAGLRHVLDTLSPSTGPMMWAIGIVVTVVGLVVLVRLARRPGAIEPRIALAGAVPLLLAAVTVGRTYWVLTYAPVLACYAAMVVGSGAVAGGPGPKGPEPERPGGIA